MKRYIRASSRSADWQEYLPDDVYDRLCMCTSRKSDIVPLTTAFYNYSSKAKKEGWSKDRCLDYILEWVLDWNGGTWEYTTKEYDRWLNSIQEEDEA